MSFVLPHLRTAWHVDQAILSEEDRLVVFVYIFTLDIEDDSLTVDIGFDSAVTMTLTVRPSIL